MAPRTTHCPPRPASLTVPRQAGGPCSGRPPSSTRALRSRRRGALGGAPLPSLPVVCLIELLTERRCASAIARSQPSTRLAADKQTSIRCCLIAACCARLRSAASFISAPRHWLREPQTRESGVGKPGAGKQVRERVDREAITRSQFPGIGGSRSPKIGDRELPNARGHHHPDYSGVRFLPPNGKLWWYYANFALGT